MSTFGKVVGSLLSLSLGAAGATAAMSSGCGTSAYVNTDGGTTTTPGGGTSDGGTPDAGEQLATAGQLCSDASACASHLCLPIAANAQGAKGVCSSACRSNADCGEKGFCAPEPVEKGGVLGDAGACFPSCSASSDCPSGIPCIWQAPFDAGLCQPLPAAFCADVAKEGTCATCLLGTACCSEVTVCAQDIECAKSETNAALAAGNAAARAVAACLAEAGPPDGGPCGQACH
jgi:hypothetical protein